MTKHILKLLHKAGMTDVPPALTPSLPGLFDIDIHSPPLDTTRAAYFASTHGALIYLLPQRGDIRKETIFLSSRNKNPTEQDLLKLVQVLRYLKSSITAGPTFSSSFPTDPIGINIVAQTDAAHAVHSNSASQSAHTISIGNSNAPFLTFCKAENLHISPDPMTAEYVSITRTAKNVVHFRQLSIELGWPQSFPSIIHTDSQSSINLTKSHIIPRPSRHIMNQFHYQRSLQATNIIKLQKAGTHNLIPDMMTKSDNKTNKFLYDRSQLFNAPPD